MAQDNLVDIYITGERHRVPDSLTILQAIEYAGYKLVRGVGCRGGFCGACATVYRLPGDYHLKFALACQTRVEPDMQLAMIPFYPANRSRYRLSELKGEAKEVLDLYPEMLRCYGSIPAPSPAPRTLTFSAMYPPSCAATSPPPRTSPSTASCAGSASPAARPNS